MKIFKLLLFIFFFSTSYAQVSVSRSHKGTFKDLRKKDYREIKKRKTVFIIDSFEEKEFNDMLSSFWDINEYITLTRSQFESEKSKYITDEYSFFEFKGNMTTTSSSRGMISEFLFLNYNYYYYSNIKTKSDNKIVYNYNEVASIYFSGDAVSMWVIIRNHSYEDIKKQLYNYKLGFLKNYLQFIQKNLKANWYSCIIANEYDKEEMKKLSKTTLYIPDYIKIQYNGWTGEDKENEKPNDLFKDYDFEYEWISSKDLNKKIFSTKEDFYYLMYTKINSTKIISIINGKTGDIIYTDFQSLSYQLKPKDLKKINRKIH